MSRWDPQPARLVCAPPRFGRPADGATVQVVTLYGPPGPSEAPAGWLMFDATADALEWIGAPTSDPGSVPATVAAAAATALRIGAQEGRAASLVWESVRLTWLSTAPRATAAAEVRAEVARARHLRNE